MYANRVGLQWLPAEDVVRFCARHIRIRTGADEYAGHPSCRVLDLGCGNGRHTMYFAQQGDAVSAVDLSEESLDICREWLRQEELDADVRQAKAEALPFGDNEFDVVVSFGVLDHMMKESAQQTFDEVRRVLKPGGLFHVNLRAVEAFDYGVGDLVAPDVYRITHGPEKGLIQLFWTQEEIERALHGFEPLNWERIDRWLDKDLSQRDSRWAVSLRRI
jgi:ubiquinone/menaquinone biosynthesis C-methylase UbiE